MTAPVDSVTFLTAARAGFGTGIGACDDLPDAPLAMPEQDLRPARLSLFARLSARRPTVRT